MKTKKRTLTVFQATKNQKSMDDDGALSEKSRKFSSNTNISRFVVNLFIFYMVLCKTVNFVLS